MDDDPVLDYIPYEEMLEENKNAGGGCLGTFLLFLLPVIAGLVWIIR